MGQKKKTRENGKTVEAKSADAGKIKKRKPQKANTISTDSTIMAQMAENVQKVMESTNNNNNENNKKRKQESVSGDKPPSTKVVNKNGKKAKGGGNQQKNKNKKQKKNHNDSDTKKKETSDKKGAKESSNNNNDDGNDEAKWSKSKKKRIRALKAKQLKKQQQQESLPKSSVAKQDDSSNNATTIESSTTATTRGGGSKLQDAFKARLSGSRFRILNEELYTRDSKDSFARFSQNPELFEQYHEGFRHQVSSWPVNPVDVIVRWIVNRYSSQIHNGKKKNNKKTKNKVTVADFGCGDAQLAKDLIQRHPDAFKVHSFDLVCGQKNPQLVTACDMANVPLEQKSVDVVVFCLALMGTNLADFIREAHRVLKDNGRVQIAEVRSRIEYSHGRSGGRNNNNKKGGSENKNSDNDNETSSTLSGTLDEFVQVLSQLGFECAKTDRSSNKMFLFLELKKNGKVPNKTLEFSAKPCIYKRR